MIQLRSVLTVADNTGAKTVYVTHVFGGSRRKFGFIGDVANAIVKTADGHGQVKESEMVKIVLVRSRKEVRRQDGSYVRFSDNAAVLIDNQKDKNPRGTRIFGPVTRELRNDKFMKIVSLAPEVL